MTTPLDLARARHQQAVADLAEAEAELLTCMLVVEPAFTGTVQAMHDRRWEGRLEGPRPLWELGQAYSAFRRAQRLEARARSAAYRAQLDEAQRTILAPAKAKRPRRHKVGLDTAEVTAGLREIRSAA